MQSMQCPMGRPPGDAGAMMRPLGKLLYEFDAAAEGRETQPLGTPGFRQSGAAFASVE